MTWEAFNYEWHSSAVISNVASQQVSSVFETAGQLWRIANVLHRWMKLIIMQVHIYKRSPKCLVLMTMLLFENNGIPLKQAIKIGLCEICKCATVFTCKS